MSGDEDSVTENHLDTNLYLGFPQQQNPVNEQNGSVPQEQAPVEDQGQGQEQAPVEDQDQGQGQFMQLLTSDSPQNIQSSPSQPHEMTPLGDFTANGSNPLIVPTQSAPPLSDSAVAAPWRDEPSEQIPHPPEVNQVATVASETRRRGRPPGGQARRISTRAAAAVDSNVEIIPPYPWATKKPGEIQSIRDLSSNNLNVISGLVHCKTCDKTYKLEYNLMEKFSELYGYIKVNKEVMRQRAPAIWSTPRLIPCMTCKSEMKPVMSGRKEEINWLFLLLGQMLGCCTLDQLRFFCQLNSKHRTGSKDRVLYITYLGLCKQLDPEGPFSL
ncbi:unnamed protein product [Arabidopsis arenosa]|uniref:DUF7086 domain-containing protein n=1 Tax=Arabidopsis arenosa TaxID=38785 RepID=A0A8S2A1W2_ARAAE|nr:unnamed protein product [Arabidopsis arenosa]